MALFQVIDDTRRRDACRSCGQPVTWFQMAKSGKHMPFDGDPVYVKTAQQDGVLIGFIDGSLSASHFASCPQAADWRRR